MLKSTPGRTALIAYVTIRVLESSIAIISNHTSKMKAFILQDGQGFSTLVVTASLDSLKEKMGKHLDKYKVRTVDYVHNVMVL